MKNKLFLLSAIALLCSINAPAMEFKRISALTFGVASIYLGNYVTSQAYKNCDNAFYALQNAEWHHSQGRLLQPQYFPEQTNLNNVDVLELLKRNYHDQQTLIPFKGALAGAIISSSLSIAILTLMGKKSKEYIAPISKATLGGSILGFLTNMPANGSVRLSPPWFEMATCLTGFGLIAWAGADIIGQKNN